jgi:hypothetical protein
MVKQIKFPGLHVVYRPGQRNHRNSNPVNKPTFRFLGADFYLGRASRTSSQSAAPRQSAALVPITGNSNPLLSKSVDGHRRKQYQLDGRPLFKPYAGSVSDPGSRGDTRSREFVAQGRMNSIEKRRNEHASVYVKRGLQPHPDPEWLRAQGTVLNQIHVALAGLDAQPHRDHLAVEVLKKIEGGQRAVYLTPIVQGFTLDDYIHDAAAYAGRFPVEELDRMKRDLGHAMHWLSQKGYVHGDVKPDNIMYDEANRRLVLIDFEIASRATDEGLNRDFIGLENACADIEWLHSPSIDPNQVTL